MNLKKKLLAFFFFNEIFRFLKCFQKIHFFFFGINRALLMSNSILLKANIALFMPNGFEIKKFGLHIRFQFRIYFRKYLRKTIQGWRNQKTTLALLKC